MLVFNRRKITLNPNYNPNDNTYIYSVSKSLLTKDKYNNFKLENPTEVALILNDNNRKLSDISDVIDTKIQNDLNKIIGTDEFNSTKKEIDSVLDVIKGGSSVKLPHSKLPHSATRRINKRANITRKTPQRIRKKRNTTYRR